MLCLPGDAADMTPSARLVLAVLLADDSDGPLTAKEIQERSKTCGRTVRYALNNLEDAGLVESGPYLRDARQSAYTLA